MKLFKCSLLLIVGLSFFAPKVFADNLDNLPLATLKQRMNHGDKNAMFKYYTKRSKDYKNKPLGQLEVMANKGDGVAAAEISGRYKMGTDGVSKDETKAAQWLEKSVKNGDDDSIGFLAKYYLDGEGVSKDVPKAISLYEQSAKKGYINSYEWLGIIYQDIRHEYGTQDLFKAKEWYEKAAKLGSPFALISVGTMYEEGLGTVQDKEKAKEYYKQACLKKEQAGCFAYKQLND